MGLKWKIDGCRMVMLMVWVLAALSLMGQTMRTVTLPTGRSHRLTQADMSVEHTTYRITGDMDLGGATVRVPKGCTLAFEGGTLSGGTLKGNDTRLTAGATRCLGTDLVLQGTWDIAAVYPQWYGARGDGRSDDTNAFEAVARLCTDIAGLTVKIPRGHYVLSRGLLFGNDVTLTGDGPETVLDWSHETQKPRCYMLFTRETLTYKQGIISGTDPEKVGLLAAKATKGDTRVMPDRTTTLKSGDIVLFQNRDKYSYSTSRDYYHQGEMAIVKRTATDSHGRPVVEFETPLFASYAVSSTDLYRLHPITVHLSGFTILSRDYDLGENAKRQPDGNYPKPVLSPAGLLIVSGRHCTLDLITGSGSSYTQVSLNNCQDCTLTNINVDYCSVAQGYNYGVAIGQSQDITVSDCRLRTTRHGLTTGGGTSFGRVIVNRNIKVSNCTFGTFPNDSRGEVNIIESLNTHGNTEYFTAERCTIDGGVNISGDYLTIKNCTISNAQNHGALVHIGPSHGNSIVVSNNVMKIDQAIDSNYKNYNYLMVKTSGVDAGATGGITFANNDITINERLRGVDEFIGVINGTEDKDGNGNTVAGFKPKLCVHFTGNIIRVNGTGKNIANKRLGLRGHIKEVTFENNSMDVGVTAYTDIDRIERVTAVNNRWANAPFALQLSSKKPGNIYGQVTIKENKVDNTTKAPFITYYVEALNVSGNSVNQQSVNKDNKRWLLTKQCKRYSESGNSVYPRTLSILKSK